MPPAIAAAILLLVPSLAAPRPSDFAEQSKDFFESLIDWKIEGESLVIKRGSSPEAVQAAFSSFWSRFQGVSSRHYQTKNGSGSSYGGGGQGSVSITFEASEEGQFAFILASPEGEEKMELEQEGKLKLRVAYERPGLSVTFQQEPGKCRLKVREPRHCETIAGRTFQGMCKEHPELVRRVLVKPLEEFFDRIPLPRASVVPPGKALLVLRDESEIVGILKVDKLPLKTQYGELAVPVCELKSIEFPRRSVKAPVGEALSPEPSSDRAGDTRVVTRRFTFTGAIELEVFEVTTEFGALNVKAEDVIRIAFGASPRDKKELHSP